MSEVNENSSINDLLDLLSDNREWAAETVRERVKQKNTAISQQAETIIELMQQLAALRKALKAIAEGDLDHPVETARRALAALLEGSSDE